MTSIDLLPIVVRSSVGWVRSSRIRDNRYDRGSWYGEGDPTAGFFGEGHQDGQVKPKKPKLRFYKDDKGHTPKRTIKSWINSTKHDREYARGIKPD
jgi:hypothetical protein